MSKVGIGVSETVATEKLSSGSNGESAIFGLLEGPAEMSLESITIEDLSAPDGAERVRPFS